MSSHFIRAKQALRPKLVALALLAGVVASSPAQEAKTARTFINYFPPMPITSPLTTNVWGAATVGPRDTQNGLEDVTMKQWDYWDGKIIKGAGRQISFVRQPLGTGARPQWLVRIESRSRRERPAHRALRGQGTLLAGRAKAAKVTTSPR